MRTSEDKQHLVDLGDAIVETKGTQVGAPDQLVGQKIGFGLAAED